MPAPFNQSQLIAEFPDNSTGAITPQNVRDLIQSVPLLTNNLSDVNAGTARTNLGLGSAATAAATAFDAAGAATSAAGTVQANLTTHTSNTSNPHAVTAAQVGAYTTGQVNTALADYLPLAGGVISGNLSVNGTLGAMSNLNFDGGANAFIRSDGDNGMTITATNTIALNVGTALTINGQAGESTSFATSDGRTAIFVNGLLISVAS
jgi:hypothetical protein